MTTEQFKFLVKSKGWLLKEVAERWGIKPRRMSVIVQEANRNPYYDDAIRGLPEKK
jgi:hypothetical protein